MPTTFKSTYHPGDSPWGIVYTRFLARPLGVCTIPLMIGATTSALLNQSVWPYLVWGLPSALALATLWTHFSMARTVAEVGFRAGQATIRSVYDVLLERPFNWKPILNVRTTSWNLELSAGRTTYEMTPEQWREYERLCEAARESFKQQQSRARNPSSR